jgi:hypothetical protein
LVNEIIQYIEYYITLKYLWSVTVVFRAKHLFYTLKSTNVPHVCIFVQVHWCLLQSVTLNVVTEMSHYTEQTEMKIPFIIQTLISISHYEQIKQAFQIPAFTLILISAFKLLHNKRL